MSMPTPQQSSLHDAIDAMRSAPESERRSLVDQIAVPLQRDIHRWSASFCASFGDVHMSHREDVESAVFEHLYVLLIKAMEPAMATPSNWVPYLKAAGRSRAMAYFQGTERTGFTEVAQVNRRRRLAERTRIQLRQSLGREPSAQEIIDSSNTTMLATRANPGKSGMLLSKVDTDGYDVSTAEMPSGVTEPTQTMDWDEPQQLARTEARALIDSLIRTCEAKDELLGEVARSWLGDHYSEPPVTRDERMIVEHTGIESGVVKSRYKQAMTVAMDLLRQRGIDSLDAF